MKPQLLTFLVVCIVIHIGYCQVPAQLTKFYNADGCNTTESLVFEYQVAVVGDGCSGTLCEPVADNLWRLVTCSQPAEVSKGLSYISSYTTATCGNETELSERIQFVPTLPSGCFDTLGAMSFYLNNTCTLNGQISLQRFSGVGCDMKALVDVSVGFDGTCMNSTYAYCVVGAPPQAPIASGPIAVPGSANPTANSPLPTSPKGPTSTPKASHAIVLTSCPYSIILPVLSFFTFM